MGRIFRASDSRNGRFGDRRIINAANSAIRARGMNPDLGLNENEDSGKRTRKIGTGKFAKALSTAMGGANDKSASSRCLRVAA